MEPAGQQVIDLYDELFAQFEEFYYQDERHVCLFKVDSQEKRLVEAIHKYENSERKKLKSLFLRITSAFLEEDLYLQEVYKEFKYIVGQAKEDYFDPNELGLDLVLPDQIADVEELFALMNDFASHFTQYPDELVLSFDPIFVSDEQSWLQWFEAVMLSGFPKDLKVVVCSVKGKHSIDALADHFEKEVVVIEPNFDFVSVMNDLAAAGDQSDPAVKFRTAFTKMTTAAQKGKWDKALTFGDEALLIAQQQQDWQHLEISIHLTIASFYLAKGVNEDAIDRYNKAVTMSDQLYQANPALGLTMLHQSLQSRAGAFMKMGLTLEAFEDFNNCSIVLEGEPGMELQRMESLRMAGTCLQHLGRDQEALEAYVEGFACAKIAEVKALPYTTLPYLGSTVIALARERNDYKLITEMEEFLQEHIGENWEQFITE